ncbi:MAG: glycyl-radical enzyme activating protein [Parvibaculum sp.]|nr:glycyl-radical enzyme activating protein [Parvibaculum sp.]
MTAGIKDAAIVDIQRFSLHDGPGIRTTVFFKGCALRCAWCQNPESLRIGQEMAFYSERCRNTMRCAAVCPEDAIIEGPDLRIDFSKCTACGLCAEACDHDAIRLIGTHLDEETLVAEILKDRDFFIDSGGGVTLSGGEPMMQAAYLKSLLPRLKAHDLHIAMQTGGLFNWAHMEPLLPHLDLIYFDLKHMDSATHKRLTGAGNEQILDNFSRIAKSGVRIEARMPVVPGFNDNEENIRATARFLDGQGHRALHCLAYHNLGEAKIPRIAPILAPLGLPSLDPDMLHDMARRFKEEGIDVIICD